ncbi:MAG TPA: NUDIX domain-containing protein [Planctomycetota bacterium]|nr:NUDIX domain-containing protein [Planctomycetota bacterium]
MEFVYVVKRADLFDLATPHGFVPREGGAAAAPGERAVLGDRVARWTESIRARGFFVERRHAELDASLKQVIPYTLVAHGDEVLLLKRLGKGGEARLHGKLSIGVGGHINPVDLGAPASGADVLDAGCRRELEEEIGIHCPYTLSPVGIINDDSSDVGSVHFGLVNVARCETKDVAIRETEVLEGSFVNVATLREIARSEPGRFETWSALIVERLDLVLRA